MNMEPLADKLRPSTGTSQRCAGNDMADVVENVHTAYDTDAPCAIIAIPQRARA